jgi:hypothetical protein
VGVAVGVAVGAVLSPADRDQALAHAVDPDLAAQHVRSVVELDDLPEGRDATWPNYVPTTLHRWKMGEREEWQIRVPEPKRRDDGPKYLFSKGAEPPLNQVRDDGTGPILIAEGTWQHLAAATYAPDKFAVYGMFGCWGWSKVDPSFMADRLVYVVFDADLDSNRDVWNAAAELRDAAKAVKAAAQDRGQLGNQPTVRGSPGPGHRTPPRFWSWSRRTAWAWSAARMNPSARHRSSSSATGGAGWW